jgi:hypothetical protein
VAQSAPDSRIILTTPLGAEELADFSPEEPGELADVAFVCFFRTEDDRARFLGRLKTAAANQENPPTAGEIAALAEEERETALVEACVRWWTSASRKPYHAYKLKADYSSFRTSCAVTFEEAAQDELRLSVLRAIQVLEEDRTRVEDFFGWGERR